MINPSHIEFGRYINKTLHKFTPESLIDLAENYSRLWNPDSTTMDKIFEQIEKERNENEFSRTEV